MGSFTGSRMAVSLGACFRSNMWSTRLWRIAKATIFQGQLRLRLLMIWMRLRATGMLRCAMIRVPARQKDNAKLEDVPPVAE